MQNKFLLILVAICVVALFLSRTDEHPLTPHLCVYNYPKKIRLGNKSDGGYVIADLPNANYDCYLSCGVSNEESFSRDFINKYGMNASNSFAFDASIERYPTEYTNKITWRKKFIGDQNSGTHTTMEDIIDQYKNIFLKMDIEGGEYVWFKHIPESKLKKIKQLVLEIHWLNKPQYVSQCEALLKKLNRTHCLIHIHGNNYERTHQKVPVVLEATFLRKDQVGFLYRIPIIRDLVLNKSKLPVVGLDYPCNPNAKDIDLNYPPFSN